MLLRFSSEGKKRGIVNISSISETGLRTYQAIYCATKAFITVFTRALAVEYKGRIDFLCTIPRQVNTRMNPGLGIKYTSPEVCHVLNSGWDTEVYGHWKHYLNNQYTVYIDTQKSLTPHNWKSLIAQWLIDHAYAV